jgi:hypothetical protein
MVGGVHSPGALSVSTENLCVCAIPVKPTWYPNPNLSPNPNPGKLRCAQERRGSPRRAYLNGTAQYTNAVYPHISRPALCMHDSTVRTVSSGL